jgi:hypothetical protein
VGKIYSKFQSTQFMHKLKILTQFLTLRHVLAVFWPSSGKYLHNVYKISIHIPSTHHFIVMWTCFTLITICFGLNGHHQVLKQILKFKTTVSICFNTWWWPFGPKHVVIKVKHVHITIKCCVDGICIDISYIQWNLYLSFPDNSFSWICSSISMVPEQILFQLWLPHLLFSRIHCFFFRPPSKTMNRGFTKLHIHTTGFKQ